MSYKKEAEEVCEKIRQIVCLDNPPNITPERAVSDFMTALFEAKDKEIAELEQKDTELRAEVAYLRAELAKLKQELK